jgi:Flp pilus assembly protein TadG
LLDRDSVGIRQRLHRDERGMALVFVGMGCLAFLGVSMLAIDIGLLMTARAQAQNAADAGALASAVALGFENYSDRSPSRQVERAPDAGLGPT